MELICDKNGKWKEYKPFCTVEFDTEEDFKLVKKAVEEYETRQSGCDFCEKAEHYELRSKNGEEKCIQEFKYCPFCGKDLLSEKGKRVFGV